MPKTVTYRQTDRHTNQILCPSLLMRTPRFINLISVYSILTVMFQRTNHSFDFVCHFCVHGLTQCSYMYREFIVPLNLFIACICVHCVYSVHQVLVLDILERLGMYTG